MIVSAAISVSFVARAARAHGQYLVWLPVLAGLLIWGAGLAEALPGVAEEVTTVLGTLILAAGLIWNGWLRHRVVCTHCGCPVHGDG